VKRVDGICETCAIGRASSEGCPFHQLHWAAGTQLLRQGEVPACVWYVRRGLVLVSSVTRDGDETECGLRGPGALVGIEALAQRPTGYEAWALSELEACRVDSPSFRSWFGDVDTPAGVTALLALDESERRRQERVVLSGRADERVARFLLEHHRQDQRVLPIEQKILARMLGMKPETMSRALSRLRRAGALAQGRTLEVVSATTLQQIVDGELA
jgi:CRP-like cAMP-binding protein